MEVKGYYVTEEYELTKKRREDAGLDICADEFITILPKSRAVVRTGIKVAVPDGHVGLLWSRSGMSTLYGVEVGAGCIDASYRGEILVNLFNHGDAPFQVEKGDRIAQLLTIPVVLAEYEKIDELDETDRGADGFGSSGR